MFDLGFSEIMLIMIVALVVVGPERLPGLARKAGYWVGRFRRYVVNVRSEIERELNADELRSMLSKQEDDIRELRDMLQDTRSQIHNEVDEIAHEVDSAGEQLRHGITSEAGSAETTDAVERGHEADAVEHGHEADALEHGHEADALEHGHEADAGEHAASPAVSGQTHSSPASGDSDVATKRDEEKPKP